MSIWLARLLLLITAVALGVLAVLPADLVQPPINRLLRPLGLPYRWLLWAEGNINLLLHFGGAALLAILLVRGELPWPRQPRHVALCLALALLLLEAVHAVVGRGFSLADLAVGAAGLGLGLTLSRSRRPEPAPHEAGGD